LVDLVDDWGVIEKEKKGLVWRSSDVFQPKKRKGLWM
jgi:hypothetical protein